MRLEKNCNTKDDIVQGLVSWSFHHRCSQVLDLLCYVGAGNCLGLSHLIGFWLMNGTLYFLVTRLSFRKQNKGSVLVL